MKTIKDTVTLTVEITKEDLLNDKWISVYALSKKLAKLEYQNKAMNKDYRTRLYNSITGGKYNVKVIAGVRFIDTTNLLKSEKASLIMDFKRV